MNDKISQEIQRQQDHGRSKWGGESNNTGHDDQTGPGLWYAYIEDHNTRALLATPMERREHLIKVAGLAVSAVEAIDREWQRHEAKRHASINDSVAEAESRRHL